MCVEHDAVGVAAGVAGLVALRCPGRAAFPSVWEGKRACCVTPLSLPLLCLSNRFELIV